MSMDVQDYHPRERTIEVLLERGGKFRVPPRTAILLANGDVIRCTVEALIRDPDVPRRRKMERVGKEVLLSMIHFGQPSVHHAPHYRAVGAESIAPQLYGMFTERDQRRLNLDDYHCAIISIKKYYASDTIHHAALTSELRAPCMFSERGVI